MSGRKASFLALLAGLLLAGCGGGQSPRDRVAAYIQKVDKIESRLNTPFNQVSSSASQFLAAQKLIDQAGGGPQLVQIEQTLNSDERQIATLRIQLAAIKAPAKAAHLRSMLIRLVSGELQMTLQLRRLVAFLPAFSHDLTPLAPATTILQHKLGATVPQGSSTSAVTAALDAKAQALIVFRHAVHTVLVSLLKLVPPNVSRPEYLAQLRALGGMGRSAAGLAHALSNNQSDIQGQLTRFDQAAALANSNSTQRAEIAAVKAYDARVNGLSTLQTQIQNERTRLDTGKAVPTVTTATTSNSSTTTGTSTAAKHKRSA